MTIITNQDHVVSVSLIPGVDRIPSTYHVYFPAKLKNGIPAEGDIYKEDDESTDRGTMD